ncbi:MAG: CZB domain-containing protein [Magnetococcales bacterium]|nr:CZB domain-containing protein [Magnetococcales bacterium]
MNELFDITNARNVHLAWEWELEAIAKGQQSVAKLPSYEDCQLGLWLHRTGINKYRDSEYIHQLMDVHRKFHTVAERIITGMNQSRFGVVEENLKEVRALSQEIVFTLTAIEFSALQKQRPFSTLPAPLRRIMQTLFTGREEREDGINEALDAGQARMTHFRWSQDLLRAFRHRGRDVALKPAESCALGVWIHNVGLKKHGDLPSLKRLDLVHKAFHHKASLSVKALQNRKDLQAGRTYEDMIQHSLEVVYLLTTIENQLQSSGSLTPPRNIRC